MIPVVRSMCSLFASDNLDGWRNVKNIRIGSLFQSTGKDSVRLDCDSIRLADEVDGL